MHQGGSIFHEFFTTMKAGRHPFACSAPPRFLSDNFNEGGFKLTTLLS